MLLGLLACTAPGPLPMDDLGGDFFDAPWPSDLRRTPSGGLEMATFPGASDLPLVQMYTELGETGLDGAGTTAPIYFRFEGPLDTSTLPATGRGSVYPSSSLFLIDVDPDSPEFGRRIPVMWDFQESDTTFQPTNLLAVMPLPGVPLRPGTTYAAGVTTQAASPHPEMLERFSSAHPDHQHYAGLQAALFAEGTGVEEVAIATVFTTQDPLAETALIADYILSELGPTSLSQELTLLTEGPHFDHYVGELWLPLWQHGTRPYSSEGGAFLIEDGEPVMHSWERVRFSFTTPKTEPPADGWPVVLYAHGTYGDWETCCSDPSRTSQAARAAQVGMAMLGFSQPLHGDRKTDATNEDLHTFNYFNPDSARANFRQGALDIVYLSHVLSARSHHFVLQGETHATDPYTTLFMGHSQGGITGAIALPFIGDRIDGAVLSGAGGGLSLSMVYREQGGLDIEQLVSEVLGFASDEELDPLHPLAGMVQTLSEVTDSANYAPYWFQRRAWFTESPVPVLMFEGMLDEHTPPITTEALAAAAGVPVVSPEANLSEAHVVLKLDPVAAPVASNAEARLNTPVTAGLAQYPDQNHFAIHNDRSAQTLYRDFLQSLAQGEPTIGAPY